MPRLILLNGPPGCGKSTLAQLYVDDHPLALSLDLDRIRGLLGGWKDRATEAGELARALALAAARAHLSAGHDVIVPQYLGRLPFIEALAELADEVGATFHELVLMDSKVASLRRFEARTGRAADPGHAEAAATVAAAGGRASLAQMYDALLEVVAQRPTTQVVPTTEGEIAETYAALLAFTC